MSTTRDYIRNEYGAIPEYVAKDAIKWVNKMITKLSRNADSHGWGNIGKSAFDKKGRGEAINWDLYGYGRDCHCRRKLAVIQVRQYQKLYKNGYANVKKSYFLIGNNEDKTAFAHPVSARAIHAAIRNGQDVVREAQGWIFGHKYEKILRQGDVGFVRAYRAGEYHGDAIVIMGTHRVTGKISKRGSHLYVEDGVVTHPTHKDEMLPGLWEIIIGRRAPYHEFVEPTAD